MHDRAQWLPKPGSQRYQKMASPAHTYLITLHNIKSPIFLFNHLYIHTTNAMANGYMPPRRTTMHEERSTTENNFHGAFTMPSTNTHNGGARAATCLVGVAACLASATSAAGNTGYIKAWLNEESCALVTYPAQDKRGIELELKPKSLAAAYLDGSAGGQANDFYYWELDSRESAEYTCHDPRPTSTGGFLQFNYFEIYNDVGGLYSKNKLTSSWGYEIISDDTRGVDSKARYFPPFGLKAFAGWPGTNSYSMNAEAYWVFGGGGGYAALKVNTSPD
jgi:hypothetical protein